MAACREVFNTPELLEMTLAYLSFADLLRMHSICRRWKQTLEDSITLKRFLFLEIEEDSTVWLTEWYVTPLHSPVPPNGATPPNKPMQLDLTLVSVDVGVQVKAAVSRASEAFESHHSMSVTPVRTNPMLHHSYHTPMNVDRKSDCVPNIEFDLVATRLLKLNNHKMMDMFLTQPPTSRVSVEAGLRPVEESGLVSPTYNVEARDRPVRSTVRLEEEGGVRLRHVLEAMESLDSRSRNDEIEGFSVFLSGTLDASEADRAVVKSRTEEWERALRKSNTTGVEV